MEQLVSSYPGPKGPGQNKKKEKESYKLQAPSFKRHEKDTIKMYKQLRKKKLWKQQLNY